MLRLPTQAATKVSQQQVRTLTAAALAAIATTVAAVATTAVAAATTVAAATAAAAEAAAATAAAGGLGLVHTDVAALGRRDERRGGKEAAQEEGRDE